MIKVFIVVFSLFLVGCNNLNSKKTFKNNFSSISEYELLKTNLRIKSRLIIGDVKNFTRFKTTKSEILYKEILNLECFKSNRFKILKDSSWDPSLEELALSTPFNNNSILAKQRFLNTDYIIFATLLNYKTRIDEEKTIFFEEKYRVGEACIEFKVIDVLNDKIWSIISKGSSQIDLKKLSAKRIDTLLNDLEEETFKNAITNGVEKIIEKIDLTPWRAAVLKKSKNELIINSGIDSNLKIGTHLKVYKLEKKLIDNGKTSYYEENFIGTATVKSYIGTEQAILSYKGVDFSIPAVVKLK